MPADGNNLTGYESSLGGSESTISGSEPSLPGEFVVLKALLADDLNAIPRHGLTRFERMQAIRQRGKAALPALLDLCHHENEGVQETAITVIGWVGDPDAIPALIDVLNGPNFRMRHPAAVALRNIGLAAEPALLPLLSSSNEETRVLAIWALGHLRSKSAVPRLIQILHEDDNLYSMQAAVAALRRIGDRTVLRALEGAIFYPEVSYEAMPLWTELFKAIFDLGGAESVDALLRIYYTTSRPATHHQPLHTNDSTLAQAFRDFKRLAFGPGRYSPVAMTGPVNTVNPANRLYVRTFMKLLGQTRSPQVLPVLQQALGSDHTRASAIRGLMQFDDPRLIPAIEPYLHASNDYIRQTAEAAVRYLGRNREL